MTGSLDGILVLDMTRVVAGPLASQMLGDLGAEVIKVERRGEGDDVRRVGPPWLDDRDGREAGESTYFQSVNRNKRSLTIDFAQPEGAELIRRIAAKADVFMENYRTGTMARYGFGYEDLKASNPGIIYCSITGFGQTGPYAGRSGYDFLIQAMGGLMSVTGWPDGEPGGGPMRVGVAIADICAGLNATIGILAALRHRDITGRGQAIDVSLFESQLASTLNPFVAWFNGHKVIPRTGNNHPSAAPYGVYEVADGYILIATFNDREFARLAQAVGHPEWIIDPRFAGMGDRVANRPALAKVLTEALRKRTKLEWVEHLNAAKVSCGPINNMADLEGDPHVAARDVVVTLPHPITGSIKLAANPIRLAETPVEYRRGPPLAGQHSAEVLRDLLGLGADEISDLERHQVI
jgi:crotonobetainyl-CoA:carnitine CoA-transferase CaiB-like acyl-CoA transferase